MPFGFTHGPLVQLANSAICSFFREIEVYGTENVPDRGPIIFASSHANMALDPAVLSNTIPHGHFLHYWVKDSLFKNPAVGALLRNAGNIAVDRKTKNNQKLFKGTFEALALDESIGVFPEGTSHTEPHMIPLKDGTSWAALEYVRYLKGTEENGGPKKGRKALVIPVGIAYVDKRKYRSRVVVQYGQAISMEQFEDQFLSEQEGESKLAVKRLTWMIDVQLKQMTVNAPDWDTAYAAQMARELLWVREDDLALKDYIQVSQTLVDLFTTPDESVQSLKTLLATYHRLLTSSRLSNFALTDISLSSTLDPSLPVSLPNRFSTLFYFLKDTLTCLIHLPFFIIPMLIHIPVYVVGYLGASLVEEEMETQAQMKVVFGLLLSLITYPVLFFVLWGALRGLALGVVLAAVSVWGLGRYHSQLIDNNYNAMKRLIASWRLLIGVWTPRPEFPLPKFLESYKSFAPDPPKVAGLPPSSQPEKYIKPKKLPSRVLVKHVLRTRLQAAKELARVLLEMEASDGSVNASFWLAEEYDGEVQKPTKEEEGLNEWEREMSKGTRGGKEVVAFLRARGARLGVGKHEEGHWAASSGGETEAE
ncbi:uncharacterized protein I303_107103 [Kwoniella dejecticola CBS 10117]|uniref:Phospholipid/glycerol acyltransferase domain-containing protein n=1 Tax=Kwoniella dejecticola CBS 10117 TaxID=1296121 RepID=A0A1A5ZYR9_9TREE|nr:uncharacterized protein I303_06505 [Kwoniella dejecticola CBS 10117]OBR82947.1 hypothetical protein I303_06505 [Kwoniella dejecticola CBS 10117]